MLDDNDDDLTNENSQNDYFNGLNLQKINSCIGEQSYELINDKKDLLQSLKQKKEKLLINYELNNGSLVVKNELIQAVIIKKMNIQMLRAKSNESNEKSKKHKEELEVVKNRIAKKKQKLSLYQDKIEICKEMLKKSEATLNNKTNNEKDGFNALKLRLIGYEKQRIDELNRFVFDLAEIKPKIDEDILQKSTRTALKDARQTIYVNGRWILANDHVLYKILRSILPCDGDYLTFFHDLQPKDNKSKDHESRQFDDIDEHFQSHTTVSNRNSSALWTSTANPALLRSISVTLNSTHKFINKHAILSGLTYTVQFVNLIAFYLNIVLPYNLPHSKFCIQPLKENQFQNAVAKLNTNIVFLSIQQNIQVTNLLPKHTLENLCHFLTNFKEMRLKLRDRHSIAFPSHLIPLLDEMFSDYEDDSLVHDTVPLIYNDNEDWEIYPNSNEIPSDDSYTNPTPSSSRNVIATSSSLISSVLSNFWTKNNTNNK